MTALRHMGKNRLLASLPHPDRELFLRDLQPMKAERGHLFYQAGSPIDYVYFVEDGLGSVTATMSDGASIEVGMVGFEGMLGIPAMLGARTSDQEVLMQIPGTVLKMNAAHCKAAFEQSPAVRASLLRFLEAFLSLSAQSAACNRLHGLEQRLSRWLLMAHDRVPTDVMPLTHEFLSTMLGVRRAGLSEVAGEIQRSGLIRYHHGQMTIIDRAGLEATACECYRHDRERFDRLLRSDVWQ